MTDNLRKTLLYVHQTHRLLYPDEGLRVLGDALVLMDMIPDRFPKELDLESAEEELRQLVGHAPGDGDYPSMMTIIEFVA